MPRTPARFTQADITRALRAIDREKANAAIEIMADGVIRIVPYEGANTPQKQREWWDLPEKREIVL